MGIFDKIKDVFSSGSGLKDDFEKVITNSRNEYAKQNAYFYDVKVNLLEAYTKEVRHWSDKKKIDFIVYCVEKNFQYYESNTTYSTNEPDHQKVSVREAYFKQLLKTNINLEDTDIELLQKTFCQCQRNKWTFKNYPLANMLNQIGKQYKGKALSQRLVEALKALRKEVEKFGDDYFEKESVKLVEKIDNIIFQSENKETAIKPTLFLGKDDFSTYANTMVRGFPEPEKAIWYQLIAKAQKASGSKPSKKYLEETKELFKLLGTDKFKSTVNAWFIFLANLKEKTEEHTQVYNNQTYRYTTYEFISSINLEAIKGFIWMCSHFHDASTIHNIANLAERSYKKIPGKGPAAASMGNACLYMLYKSRGLDGIGQLSRLKLRIKQSNTAKLIDNYLEQAAKEQGVSIHEIEDLAVEDFGLKEGRKIVRFDEVQAEIELTGIGKSEIRWLKPDGTPQKSIPSMVKEKHSGRLKRLKDTLKLMDQTTSAQRDRLDRMFRANRRFKMDYFICHFLNHGLMNKVCQNLIWTFTFEDKKQSGILINNQWIDNQNRAIDPHESSTVSLWHPAEQSLSDIKNWRDFIFNNQIKQPLKQGFREVYLLTDAEIKTRIYSNRMAAHILKQHQFNMLAKTRGWRYSLLGAYDDGRYNQAAEVLLPEFGLKAEYWVNEVNANDAFNDTGIWNYIATDQIRFIDSETNAPVELIDVPTVLFSEVLRDVDLFVGVASVGNDPVWRDSGGVPAHRDYWTSYSFGDLSEVAKNRKEILEGLVPRLKIRNIAEVKDKFLVVKGKLRTYKIHIGSTNILMEPNDQYLCIVPDRSQKSYTENLFIPFEGDNGLSIILSKAFLLAEDDKITDTTITSQINRK